MRIFLRILLGLVAAIVVAAVVMNLIARSERGSDADYHHNLPKNIRLETSRISSDSTLAVECTCEGGKLGDRSPDLYWRTDLTNVKTFAITMTDPDVPTPAFPLFNLNHWVVYDILPSYSDVPVGLTAKMAFDHGAHFGKNSMGDLKYIGPCPPMGKHTYIFRIYALDKRFNPKTPMDKQQLLDAMKGHILGYGELKTYYAAQ